MQKEGLLQNQEPEESPKIQEDRGVPESLPKGAIVVRSSDGRVGIMSSASGLPPMIKSPDGTWSRGVFDATEMMEDCTDLETTEASTFFAEAKKEFESNPSRFKSLKPKIEYRIYTDDNFHRMDETEIMLVKTLYSAEEAIAEAKRIIDESLRWLRIQSQTPDDADKLYDRYTDFGTDAVIESSDPNCNFSAWDYAKEKSKEIVKEDITDKELYNFNI